MKSLLLSSMTAWRVRKIPARFVAGHRCVIEVTDDCFPLMENYRATRDLTFFPPGFRAWPLKVGFDATQL